MSSLSIKWTGAIRKARSLLQFPDTEPVDVPFAPADIARLHRLRIDTAAASIDDATWKDLLLDAYAARLADQVSIFGQQVLHQRLRSGLDDARCAALGERVRELMREPERLAQLHRACKPLRHADTEIAGLLFGDAMGAAPWWAGLTWVLPFVLLASILAAAWSPLAWLGTGALVYLLMSAQMRYYHRVDAWQRSLHSLQMLLRACSLLGARREPLLAPFAVNAAVAGQLNRGLARASALALVPGLGAYMDWFMLANVRHYFDSAARVGAQRGFLRDCFLRCAELEADIALARHLLAMPSTCWAERGGARELALAHTVHPLLPHAQPLSMTLNGKGAFISGQNGVGKSTLLRTVGLNLLAARAFGFCYAHRARVPHLPVYASMQSEDTLLGGESLYMAELRRAQELLAAANGPHPGIYIVDEIFRGTNHLESVSAAAAVLDALAAKGLVIVSSHNLVLAALLEHRLAALCVSTDDSGVLALAPGVLAHTNGIALLAQRGFGPEIEAAAGKVFGWLSGYLAQPAHCAHLLAEPAPG